jgi:hypothetical protein
MGNYPFGGNPALALQAATPVAGFALVNSAPTILTWNVPNDGQLHRFIVAASMDVTVNEVGGLVGMAFTMPDGTFVPVNIFAANANVGFNPLFNAYPYVVGPGTTVTVRQFTALTLGAAVLWAEIWGS